jgi:hypothetical protein
LRLKSNLKREIPEIEDFLEDFKIKDTKIGNKWFKAVTIQ